MPNLDYEDTFYDNLLMNLQKEKYKWFTRKQLSQLLVR